ncbi:hypothetical protein VTI74DRAFT_9850 [Chaetomium olivicolor]
MRAHLLSVFPLLAHAVINWDIYEYGVVPSYKWTRPFPDDGTDPGGYHVDCKASATFHAKMYKLKDLPDAPPTGLAPWHDAIEDFLGHSDYMGSWDGVDHKGQDREIVVMEWTDAPDAVKLWIEEQQRDESETNQKKWMFGVFEKPKKEGGTVHRTGKEQQQETVERGLMKDASNRDKMVGFPAGVIYEILPLWVAKGSGCERDLSNLAKYKPQAIDHAVLACVVDHTKPNRDFGKRDITFKVEAMSVTESEDGKRARLMWEKMHRTIKRNDRKLQREERQKARREMEERRARDEL